MDFPMSAPKWGSLVSPRPNARPLLLGRMHAHPPTHAHPACISVAAGGGAWGTALGIHAARMGHKVLLWAREPEVSVRVSGRLASSPPLSIPVCVWPSSV